MGDRVLRELVHVRPAANQDGDERNDRHWLDASLRNPDLLQQACTPILKFRGKLGYRGRHRQDVRACNYA